MKLFSSTMPLDFFRSVHIIGVMKTFILIVLTSLLVGCSGPTPIDTNLGNFREIQIIETGLIRGYDYVMILDRQTGRRILSIRSHGMVVLPEQLKTLN